MKFEFVTLHNQKSQEHECIVVLDVLRAFTTAAVAFSKQAEKIIPVSSVEEAFALRERGIADLIMGEIDAAPVQGFDLSNSPTELEALEVKGKIIVHRTTAGTQGIVKSLRSKSLFAASFVCAGATVEAIKRLNPSKVVFVITGAHSGADGDEDMACAEYIAERLSNGEKGAADYLERVRNSTAGHKFGRDDVWYLPKSDLDFACRLDRYDFAMKVFGEGEYPYLLPVYAR